VLDYTILVAITALTVPSYLAAFWSPLGHGAPEIIVAIAVIAFVAADNLTGVSAARLRRRMMLTWFDLAVQIAVIVLGLVLVFDPARLKDAVDLWNHPTVAGLLFALPIAVIAFTGLEAAASLAGEVQASGPELKRLIGPGAAVIVLIYVGIAIVGVGVLPVHHHVSELGTEHLKAPMLGIVEAYTPKWLADVLKYVVAVTAAAALVAAADASMIGVSRTGYSMATNRQIPGGIGRLHQRYGTPSVIIGLATVASIALALPTSPDLLIGIYAFGAMLAFTIAHVSVIALRYREPKRDRPYRIPLSVPFRGGTIPIPAVVGAILALTGWVSVVVLHAGARYVGGAWLLTGILLYVVYRKTEDKPLLKRVTIPDRALRHEALEPEFGSILVPVFGSALDDDIIQTAGRLAGTVRDDLDTEGAMIEAIWVLEVPMALPLDASLPEPQLKRAREALARAKVVGEEYEGVQVATALVRARRIGQGIVSEAKRRGVEAIVLAAEDPSRVKGGSKLGAGRPLDNYLGEVTRYVIRKAPCRVILTAAPEDGRAREPESRSDQLQAKARQPEPR
jgi:APA family basic amino acid/polyamine antiporter